MTERWFGLIADAPVLEPGGLFIILLRMLPYDPRSPKIVGILFGRPLLLRANRSHLLLPTLSFALLRPSALAATCPTKIHKLITNDAQSRFPSFLFTLAYERSIDTGLGVTNCFCFSTAHISFFFLIYQARGFRDLCCFSGILGTHGGTRYQFGIFLQRLAGCCCFSWPTGSRFVLDAMEGFFFLRYTLILGADACIRAAARLLNV